LNAVLVISERDNVATALEALDAGRAIQVGARTLLVAETIPRGHKIALCAIPLGEPVVKYGSPIGRASAGIAPGTHVHTHNVASTRGRGDLAAFHIAEFGLRTAEVSAEPEFDVRDPQSAIRNPESSEPRPR
jgi:altronate dehydratase small subunit